MTRNSRYSLLTSSLSDCRLSWLIMILLSIAVLAFSQDLRATTEDGRSVILRANGTWQFSEAGAIGSGNPTVTLRRPVKSTSSLKYNDDKIAIWYDPTLWTPQPIEEPTKRTFINRDGDVYAVIISERIAASLDSLKQLAISNLMKADPSARITSEESRLVNGVSILCMQFEATVSGVQIIYYNYYYSGAYGVAQIVTFTSKNLFARYEAALGDFLNGLVISNKF